jgi:Amt family ammonium transporter
MAAALVFFMQAGFAMVEAGFTRAKNAVNIIMKNLMDFPWAPSPSGPSDLASCSVQPNGLVRHQSGFFLSDFTPLTATPGCWPSGCSRWCSAATAATIVSGAMAERTKFTGYLAYSAILSAPLSIRFSAAGPGAACSTAAAGWKAWASSISPAPPWFTPWAAGRHLAGAIVLGPASANTAKTANPEPHYGHNMPLAALGVFILWLGWFGFNPGSTTTADKSIAMIFVNTNLAAAAGAIWP